MSNRTSVFLTKTVSNSDENEYVSPFRSQMTTFNKKQLQVVKTSKFPTISATSDYNQKSTKELGFKTIHDSQPRIKDIKMPKLLVDNSTRQFNALTDLDAKEANLHLLKQSQQITDLTPSSKKSSKRAAAPQIKDTRQSKINNFAIDYDFVPPKEIEPAPENKIEQDYIADANEIEMMAAANDDQYAISTEQNEELRATIEMNNIKDANDMILENKVKFNKPLDPSLAPKVHFNTDSSPSTNPKATPENKELIVKIPKYGYVSKAVYDQMTYEDLIQQNKINDLKSNYKVRSERKRQLCKEKINKIDIEKLNTINKINELKLKHLNDLETIENEKIYKLFQINGTNVSNKYNIIHNTESLKLLKLNQLKFQRQKQSLLQSQLNELSVDSNKINNEYQSWNNDLIFTMEQLDAQMFKLKQCNYKQDQLNEQINKLTNDQKLLQDEIDLNLSKDKQNINNVQDLTMGKHDFNNKLNNIQSEIENKTNLMSIIKQEIANENLNLLKLTNEIELNKQKREDEWNEKLNSNTTMFETKLNDKQVELDTMLQELKLKHDQQLKDLESSFTQQLETNQQKLQEEQKTRELAQSKIDELNESKLNLQDQYNNLTNDHDHVKSKLDSQTKLTMEAQAAREASEKLKRETEIKMNYANELLNKKLSSGSTAHHHSNNIPIDNDSAAFSLLSEEEIVYK